ncbi:MAG: hypothetical protein AAF824_06485 [Bacteroidota bacterium]
MKANQVITFLPLITLFLLVGFLPNTLLGQLTVSFEYDEMETDNLLICSSEFEDGLLVKRVMVKVSFSDICDFSSSVIIPEHVKIQEVNDPPIYSCSGQLEELKEFTFEPRMSGGTDPSDTTLIINDNDFVFAFTTSDNCQLDPSENCEFTFQIKIEIDGAFNGNGPDNISFINDDDFFGELRLTPENSPIIDTFKPLGGNICSGDMVEFEVAIKDPQDSYNYTLLWSKMAESQENAVDLLTFSSTVSTDDVFSAKVFDGFCVSTPKKLSFQLDMNNPETPEDIENTEIINLFEPVFPTKIPNLVTIAFINRYFGVDEILVDRDSYGISNGTPGNPNDFQIIGRDQLNREAFRRVGPSNYRFSLNEELRPNRNEINYELIISNNNCTSTTILGGSKKGLIRLNEEVNQVCPGENIEIDISPIEIVNDSISVLLGNKVPYSELEPDKKAEVDDFYNSLRFRIENINFPFNSDLNGFFRGEDDLRFSPSPQIQLTSLNVSTTDLEPGEYTFLLIGSINGLTVEFDNLSVRINEFRRNTFIDQLNFCDGSNVLLKDATNLSGLAVNNFVWRWQLFSSGPNGIGMLIKADTLFSSESIFEEPSQPGTYFARLEIEDPLKFNCFRPSEKEIVVNELLENYPLDGYTFTSEELSAWRSSGNSTSDNKWQLAVVEDASRLPTVAEGPVWLLSGIEAEEESFLYGPCFSIPLTTHTGNTPRPMFSANLNLKTTENIDGLVVQITEDNGRSWQTLGLKNSGLEWYNSDNILSNFDGLTTNLAGWSGDLGKNYVGHYLDDYIGKIVGIRLRYKTILRNSNLLEKEFASIDSIFVGERSKNVIVERFTNVNTWESQTLENQDSYSFEVHMSDGDLQDILFTRNPKEQRLRTLFYSVPSPEKLYVDGLDPKGLVDVDTVRSVFDPIRNRALLKPKFALLDVDCLGCKNEVWNEGEITVDFKLVNQTNSSREVLVLIAFVAQKIDSLAGYKNQTVKNSLISFLGDPTGEYKYVIPGSVTPFSSKIRRSDFPNFDYGITDIIIFVQDLTTKEIYQAHKISDAFILKKIEGLGGNVVRPDGLSIKRDPYSEQLTISQSLDEPTFSRFDLIDISGKVYLQGRLPKDVYSHIISLNRLSTGIYILRLGDEYGFSFNQKIFVSP